MANKHEKMQHFIRLYKEETGKIEVDMKEVAKFAVAHGMPLSAPLSAIDRLAKEFAHAARDEMRYDKKTGKPYRANHAISYAQGNKQLHLWIDIDEALRKPMVKSLIARREQMVGDGLQLTLDADHWNSIHPNEEAIKVPMDFTQDILWRQNAPDEEEKAV